MSDLQWFLDQHRVFTWDEFVRDLGQGRTEQTLRTRFSSALRRGGDSNPRRRY